jgi:hypothetical protein
MIDNYLAEVNVTSSPCIRELDALPYLNISARLMNYIANKQGH